MGRGAAKKTANAPRYDGLEPASKRASAAARGSSKKSDTKCELVLRSSLWQVGCRFRKNLVTLPGRPDVVFTKAKVAVFCDGDFWHGRNWAQRRAKLKNGTNPDYWVAKIERNIERDVEHTKLLQEAGWVVLRFWETDILSGTNRIVEQIVHVVDERGHRTSKRRPRNCHTDSHSTAAPKH